jgi:hypothetical protein
MRRFDKTKNILKANILAEQRYLESKGLIKEEYSDIEVGADKYDEMENLKKEGNFIDNLTNLLESGKYFTDYGVDDDKVDYYTIAFDSDNKLAYSLYDKSRLTLYGYDRGDGTTGPGMGDLGEFKYNDLTDGVEVLVYDNVVGEYSSYEEIDNALETLKPIFKFKYDNANVYGQVDFPNEEIEDKVRHNIVNRKPDY